MEKNEICFEFHNTEIQQLELIKPEKERGANWYLQEALHNIPTVFLM